MCRSVIALLAACTLALVSGCATVTGSSTQSLAVETHDQTHQQLAGADCKMSNSKGNWSVRTPGATTITRSNDPLLVQCAKDGHPPGTATAISATRAAMFGNIILGGVIGAVADHASGSAYEYPNMLRIVMGSAISVGPPDLSGDGQPPAVFTPTQTESRSAAVKSETPATEMQASVAASTRDPRLPARMPRVGDQWKYRYTDRWTNLTKGPILHEIAAVSEKEIREYTRLEKGGAGGYDQRFGPDVEFIEYRLSGIPEFAPYLQAFDLLEKPGSWQGIPAAAGAGDSATWTYRGHVTGKDIVSVPAGTFTATRVELTGSRTLTETHSYTASSPGRYVPARSKIVVWYVPEVKRVVKFTRDTMNAVGGQVEKDTYELLEYKVQ